MQGDRKSGAALLLVPILSLLSLLVLSVGTVGRTVIAFAGPSKRAVSFQSATVRAVSIRESLRLIPLSLGPTGRAFVGVGQQIGMSPSVTRTTLTVTRRGAQSSSPSEPSEPSSSSSSLPTPIPIPIRQRSTRARAANVQSGTEAVANEAAPVSVGSGSSGPTATVASDNDGRRILQDWIVHSSAAHHDLDGQRASEIRSALLRWYVEHRRKLPWRGDPPPFDGSTSGINGKNNGNRAQGKPPPPPTSRGKDKGTGRSMNGDVSDGGGGAKQQSISSFFTAGTNSSSRRSSRNDRGESTSDSGIEIDLTNSSATINGDICLGLEPDESLSAVCEKAIPVTGYGVWVSEVMLQQTRVEAVIPYWIKWMKSFPTVHDLAAASDEEVNAHWAGLGFYRRARLLHQGAKDVVRDHGGRLPTTPDQLLKIQGIGPYTAAAIASIAYDVCVPVVDGNVCRVLSRLTGIANHIKHPTLKDRLGWKLAAQIVEAGDGGSPGLVNQALMELGATYCAPAGSGVDPRDPLKEFYLSTRLGLAYLDAKNADSSDSGIPSFARTYNNKTCCELCDPVCVQSILEQFQKSINSNTTREDAARCGHAAFPTDPPKKAKREEDLAMAVISNQIPTDEVRYLMVRRPEKGLLAGQWEFPNVCVRKRDNKEKESKGPTKAERQGALTDCLLDDVFVNHANAGVICAVQEMSRVVLKDPLDHIFSHVRHIMWLEVGALSIDVSESLAWKTTSGKQVRWMSQADMDEVGVTSGVKKVLNTVQKSKSFTMSEQPKSQNGSAKKRKR